MFIHKKKNRLYETTMLNSADQLGHITVYSPARRVGYSPARRVGKTGDFVKILTLPQTHRAPTGKAGSGAIRVGQLFELHILLKHH